MEKSVTIITLSVSRTKSDRKSENLDKAQKEP